MTLAFLAAVPALAALIFSASVLLIVAVGGTARWLDNDLNLAEAALIGDVGRVYRLLEEGVPTNATYPLRASKPFEKKARIYKELTPLHAAIVGDREAVLALLLERGVAGTPPDINVVWCMAREKNARSVDEWLLEKVGGPENVPSCP